MNTILFLSYDGLTDPLGQSQILPYITGASKNEYAFTIISFEKKERVHRVKVIEEICETHNITWIRCSFSRNPPYLAKLYDLYKFYLTVKRTLKKSNFNIVHCRSYQSTFIACKLKKQFQFKLIFDMRGFWVDERVDGNLWDLRKPWIKWIYNYSKKQEKSFLYQSDSVVCLTEAGKQEMLKWPKSHIYKHKITVIPCCVDIDLFDPKSIEEKFVNEKLEELRLTEEDFVLTYLGSIGTWYMLDEMLHFYKMLIKVKPNAKFLFITPESDHHIIRSKISLHDIKAQDIRIVESERKAVPIYLSVSDYSIFFIKPAYSKISSSPTKQGEIMALGIPSICNSGVGDTTEIVKKYKSGISVDEMTKVSFAQTIELMDTKKFEIDHLRKGAISYFSLENGIKKYCEIYKRLIPKEENSKN